MRVIDQKKEKEFLCAEDLFSLSVISIKVLNIGIIVMNCVDQHSREQHLSKNGQLWPVKVLCDKGH